MGLKTNLKSWAPAIAIALIVLGALAAERWLVPHSDGPRPAPIDERNTAAAPMPEALPQAPSDPSTWPLYHGAPNLTGSTDAALPDRLKMLWQYHGDGPLFQAPVSDEKGIYIAARRGTVTALNFDGTERWTRSLPSGQGGSQGRIEAPIACVRSTVLVGAGEGTIYALDADNGEDRWTYSVGGPVLGTVNFLAPADASEPVRLFVIKQDDGAMHCIDFATGQGLWQSAAISRCDGSAAVGDGFVVYGSCAAALHVIDATDGGLVRTIDLGTDCQVAGGPALVGDEIYSGSRCNRVVRVDAQTGQIVWSNDDSRKEIFTTPAVARDLVVFASEDEGVYAVDRASGGTKWRFDSQGLPTSPVVAGDKVIVGSDGVLYILELDTGRELWNYEVSDGITPPAVINGMLVVGSEDGTVVAFGAEHG